MMGRRVLVAIVVVAGCQTEEGQPVPLEDLSPALSTVFCDRVFDCYGAADRESILGEPASTDEQTCTRYFTAEFDEQLVPTYQAIAAGETHYDGDAATSCLSTIAEVSCDAIRRGFDIVTLGCDDVFLPGP
jgi:hypothetical protein